jgi:hypothetical protein
LDIPELDPERKIECPEDSIPLVDLYWDNAKMRESQTDPVSTDIPMVWLTVFGNKTQEWSVNYRSTPRSHAGNNHSEVFTAIPSYVIELAKTISRESKNA